MPDLPISRQMGCPACGHEHMWLSCHDEMQQLELLDRFAAEWLTCRAMVT